MLVYHSLVGSKLRYGLICWGSASKFLLDKVTVANNKTITYMAFTKRCVRIWPLFRQLNVLPLSILIQIEYGKIMFKFENNMLPEAFNNYFQRPSHQHHTRFAQNNYQKVRITSAKEKSLLKFIGPNIWIKIPLHIKTAKSLLVFINSCRTYLIGNYNDP